VGEILFEFVRAVVQLLAEFMLQLFDRFCHC